MLCQFYKNVIFALSITDYFLSLQQQSIINSLKTITTMAEDKKKQKPAQLQEEQLDEVNGGDSYQIPRPEDDFLYKPFSDLL